MYISADNFYVKNMSKKQVSNTPIKLTLTARFLKFFDRIFTCVDSAIYIWYSIQNNTVKMQTIDELKRQQLKRKKPDNSEINLNSLFKKTVKDINLHFKQIPFLIRVLPSVLLATLLFFLI